MNIQTDTNKHPSKVPAEGQKTRNEIRLKHNSTIAEDMNMLNAEDIRGYNLIVGLEETELSKIAKLCARKYYEAYTILFDPQTIPDDVYLLECGNETIQIEIPTDDGHSGIIVHVLSKGETFGWAPLCPNRIRTSTARVVAPSSVIQLNGSDLKQLCDENHHMGYMIMKNLSGIINSRLDSTILVLRNKLHKSGKMKTD